MGTTMREISQQYDKNAVGILIDDKFSHINGVRKQSPNVAPGERHLMEGWGLAQ